MAKNFMKKQKDPIDTSSKASTGYSKIYQNILGKNFNIEVP